LIASAIRRKSKGPRKRAFFSDSAELSQGMEKQARLHEEHERFVKNRKKGES
jgi:hypothetical protein